MITKSQIKTSLDYFLVKRGIDNYNFHLNENSILLNKILKLKNRNKNINNNFPKISVYNDMNLAPKRKIITTRLIKKPNKDNIYNININQKNNNTIYNNYISNFAKTSKDINTKENNSNNNLSIKDNIFYEHLEKNIPKQKEYIFHTSIKSSNIPNDSILKRFNKNKNHNFNTNSSINFGPNSKNSNTNSRYQTEKKLIYEKKIKKDKFKKNQRLSRNKTSFFFTQNNSKENSICNSIDFSIINKTSSINDKSNFFSQTNENFFILSNKKNNNKTKNKVHIHLKNKKFLNHFIKYCYSYYISIVKQFFHNFKKISNENLSNISHNYYNHIINPNSNLFEEFNKEDFDRETIKNKTSENFFDTSSLSFISTKNRQSLVYNRNKRIINQNYQKKNLMKLLDNSIIETSNKYGDYVNENNKFIFDNEKEKDKENNLQINSPFFNGKSDNKISENNNMTYSKSKAKDNIVGFIQINNEINPFRIKNNILNFFNESKNIESINLNQQSEEEILSFRQKNPEPNNILSIKTSDNKLTIDIKYFSNGIYNKKNKNKNIYDDNDLSIDKFNFQICNNIIIKKISIRLKDSRVIKEREDIIDLKNEQNRKNYLYSLSVIKEEEDEKNIIDSSKQKSLTKFENYYNISNNSKLFSKTSIEKLIDGEKSINSNDIDNILTKSSSRYKYNNNKKSQEIMVVSNFNSVMRSRINRKENAKSLIRGLLILIKFFGNICFNIRKKTFYKLFEILKIERLMKAMIRYIYKYTYNKIIMKKYIDK